MNAEGNETKRWIFHIKFLNFSLSLLNLSVDLHCKIKGQIGLLLVWKIKKISMKGWDYEFFNLCQQ